MNAGCRIKGKLAVSSKLTLWGQALKVTLRDVTSQQGLTHRGSSGHFFVKCLGHREL